MAATHSSTRITDSIEAEKLESVDTLSLVSTVEQNVFEVFDQLEQAGCMKVVPDQDTLKDIVGALGMSAYRGVNSNDIKRYANGLFRLYQEERDIVGALSTNALTRSNIFEVGSRNIIPLFGVGVAYGEGSKVSQGVSLGVPVNVLQMYLGAASTNMLFGGLQDEVIGVIGLDIARTNNGINERLKASEKRVNYQLEEAAAWHLAVMEKINQIASLTNGVPCIRPLLDSEHIEGTLYQDVLNTRASHNYDVPAYSGYQDALIEWARLQAGEELGAPEPRIIKTGWAVASNEQTYRDEVRLMRRLTESDEQHRGGADEFAFDLRTAQFMKALHSGDLPSGFVYTPAPGTLLKQQPLGCPYTAKEGREGDPDSHGRVFMRAESNRLDMLLDHNINCPRKPRDVNTVMNGFETHLNLIDFANRVFPGLLPEGDPEITNQRAVLDLLQSQYNELNDPDRRGGRASQKVRDRHMDQIREQRRELYKLMHTEVGRRLPALIEIFAPTQAEIDAQKARVREVAPKPLSDSRKW